MMVLCINMKWLRIFVDIISRGFMVLMKVFLFLNESLDCGKINSIESLRHSFKAPEFSRGIVMTTGLKEMFANAFELAVFELAATLKVSLALQIQETVIKTTAVSQRIFSFQVN